jgi:hypothetical protein
MGIGGRSRARAGPAVARGPGPWPLGEFRLRVLRELERPQARKEVAEPDRV